MKLKNYSPTESKVSAVAQSVVDELGYKLWDIRYEKEGASWYLRVYIDKTEGIIDIDDCVAVNRPLDKLLDSEYKEVPWDIFEVCSPGLERELTRQSHFEEYTGYDVAVKTIRPVDGVRDFFGTLSEFDNEKLTLKGENEVSLKFAEIASVKIIDNTAYEGEDL